MIKGQNDWYEKGTGLTLAVGWDDSELFPEGFFSQTSGGWQDI